MSSSSSSSRTNSRSATDFSKLVLQEIGLVKESFEAVKINASQKTDQANLAQNQFEQLMVLPAERDEERDYKLRQLKIKVSKMRMQIPFKLIAPEEQPHLNITKWYRLEFDLYGDKQISQSIPDIDNNPAPVPYHDIEYISQGIQFWEREFLACFVFDPKNAVIKRCLLYSLEQTLLETYDIELRFLVEKRLVEAVYQKSNLAVDGYWMHPSLHSNLRSESTGFREWADMYMGRCHDFEEKFIYHTAQDFQQLNNNRTGSPKTVLHLGKWNNSTEQHIEIIDQFYFFKQMSKHTELRSLSLRRVSMIQELPEFITKLESLRYLDLRAYHNLEVIPPSIADLKENLI